MFILDTLLSAACGSSWTLMKLEEAVLEIGKGFGLTAEDLNLDLGPITLI